MWEVEMTVQTLVINQLWGTMTLKNIKGFYSQAVPIIYNRNFNQPAHFVMLFPNFVIELSMNAF